MRWPSLSDYNEAIQNPSTAFEDVELKTGKPELDRLGIPRARTGRFACVYKIQCGQRNWAVRCFSQETTDQQERYAAISHHLHGLNLPYLAAFEYLSRGIRVGGQWYPILKMEWVQGDSIVTYVARNSKDPRMLVQLASKWVAMLDALQKSGIAHGDLQHGNILVADGNFKLVDYDGMYVPALARKRSNELGEPNYQHPKRTALDFGPYLDNFSAWVIYLAIVTLAADAQFRSRVTPDDEFLLFRKEDFDLGRSSSLLRELERSSNPTLRSSATYFRSLLYFEPKQIPGLNEEPFAIIPASASTVAQNPTWVSDHITATTKSAASAGGALSSGGTDASWVLDLTSPPRSRKRFSGRYIAPRIFGFVSVVITAIVAALLFQAIPPLTTGFSDLEILLVLVLTDAVLASFAIIVNALFLAWSYEHQPVTREKKSLLLKEKEAVKKRERIRTEIGAKEKDKSNYQKQLERDRGELDALLTKLHVQEKAEQDRLSADPSSPLSLLKSLLADLNWQEQNELTQLKSKLGKRVNSVTAQLNNLPQEESREINDAIQKIEVQYINDELRKHSIEKAPLFPGTQYTSQSVLINNLRMAGITTAYDISSWRVDAVPQFGPKRTAALVNWRNNLEQAARQRMPSHLTSNVRQEIQRKYTLRCHSLENERRMVELEYASEERTCLNRHSEEKLRLQNEIAVAQKQVDGKARDISAKYTPRYVEISNKMMTLASEFNKRNADLDQRIASLRQQQVMQNWECGKIRHELDDYRGISQSKYFLVVWVGRR
jgi:hypothetical protein